MIAGDITKQYLRRFPNASSKQLARMLTKEHPLLFTEESARGCVRYYRGAKGKEKREALATDEFLRPIEEAIEKKYNPFGLPDPVPEDWSPVGLPLKSGRGLVMADTHIPYHDIGAITAGFKWAKEEKYTDFVLLDGDIQDCYMLSRFQKDPDSRPYDKELEDVKVFLESLRKVFPNALIIWKDGNHDKRLESYLRRVAPELLKMQDYIRGDYLGFDKSGVVVVRHDTPIVVGKLNILHGHEIPSFSAVNPARGMFLKALECTLSAHLHRTSQHAEVTMSGKLNTSWSIGCLCQLHPEYARINKWNHGVAGLEFDGDDFEVENKRIFEGKVR